MRMREQSCTIDTGFDDDIKKTMEMGAARLVCSFFYGLILQKIITDY